MRHLKFHQQLSPDQRQGQGHGDEDDTPSLRFNGENLETIDLKLRTKYSLRPPEAT